ncbi:MAG: TonB-dependent receptor [Paludibacteraceae bacterium]|nr:TonB-dependent receptor [Paludibacteraceae bacterium]
MRKVLLSSMILLTGVGVASARTIKGTVSDADDVLPGANVVIKGTTQGTTTDMDGKYELDVENGQTIEISYVGYTSKVIKITAATKEVTNIKLTTDDNVMEEVVVVGYGVQKKSDLTGSVSAVREEKLKETVSASIDQALQGRVSGVQVNASSGQPGAASTVRVRGTSSLTGNNDPLYVIDGMPIGNGLQSNGANPLAAINPADIVSMEVLKDASATAIYGSRAANGVIMVTTRKGKNGDAKINYSGQLMISEPSKKLDVMNLQEYADFVSSDGAILAFKEDSEAEYLRNTQYLGKGTDWQDEMLSTAIGHQHQLSISGGDEKTTYAYSFGYLNQDGVLMNTNYERFNGRVNLENQTKSWLRTGISLAYAQSEQTKQPGFDLDNSNAAAALGTGGSIDENNPLLQALKQKPTTSPYRADGSYSDISDLVPTGQASAIKVNPVALAKDGAIHVNSHNINGNAFAQIQFCKDLIWRNELGIDYTSGEDHQYKPEYVNTDKSRTLESYARQNMYWRGMSSLTYSFKINPKNSGSLMLASEVSKASWNGTYTKKDNFLDNNMTDADKINTALGETKQIGGYKGFVSTISYLGRFNYNYDERYMLTATGRYDGTSVLSEDNRWGFFPSFSLAWRINQESFIQDSKANDWLSNLKLRVGYGQTGNAGNTINYIATYTQDNTGELYQSRMGNPDLVWETNWQVNGGLDFGFINNRISGSFDVYLKRNNDLILDGTPGSTVAPNGSDYYTKPSVENTGSIENTGFDISLNTQNVVSKIAGMPFDWSTDINFSLVRNKVIELNNGGEIAGKFYAKSAQRYICLSREGDAPGLFYGYKTDGVIQNTEQLNSKTRATGTQVGDLNFVDVNGDNAIDENDMTIIGDPNPDFTFGFGNSLSLGDAKNSGIWNLSIFFSGSYGNDVFNLLRMSLDGMDEAGLNYSKDVLDYAVVRTKEDGSQYVENAGTDMPRPTTEAGQNCTVVSDRYVEDGSFIRLQNIALSYTFPSKWTDKMHLSNLKLSANVQNVYTFTSYTGYNPEVACTSPIQQGVDFASYPSPRMFVFGLSLDF